MRELVRQFVRMVADTLPVREPIYEFGSFQVAGQEGLADLRPLFPGLAYVGCDRRPGPGVDRVVDVHATGLAAGAAATVLCLDALEHFESPWRAVAEMRRVLRPDGLLVLTSVLNWPIHQAPEDYWRFTADGLRLLLAPFAGSFCAGLGDAEFPHTVIGLGFCEPPPALTRFHAEFAAWRRGFAPRRLVRVLSPLLPPVVRRRLVKPPW